MDSPPAFWTDDPAKPSGTRAGFFPYAARIAIMPYETEGKGRTLFMEETTRGLNFLEEIITEDLKTGRVRSIVTRFPPEPHGYLHIGHAKSICINFGIAEKFRTGSPAPLPGEVPPGFPDPAGWVDRLLRRWRSGVSLIPFGPFLCGGSLTLFFCGESILDWFRMLLFPA